MHLKPTLRPVLKPRARSQELVERTGRNPCYEYLQLGCSQRAVQRMLHFARTQCVGKPFSNYGMARSVLWPRNTDGSSFFCAGALTHQTPRSARSRLGVLRRARRRSASICFR